MRAVAFALLACVGIVSASAQAPKQIIIVVPFSAGGTSDVALRIFADVIQRNSGPRIIVDNRPGGGGTIAAMVVKSARPDGATLRLADIGTDAILPGMQDVPYDPSRDFQAVTMLMSWDQFLTVPVSNPARSIDELISLARTKPGGLNFGSQGAGSGGHILGVMFQAATGIKMVHVPYKGGAPLAMDLTAGRVDFAFNSYREMKSALDDNKVRMLGVARARRSRLLPELATLAELGIKGVELSPWFGLVAPAGTPQPVVQQIRDFFATAADDPDLQRRFAELGIDPDVTDPGQFAAYIASERAKYDAVVKAHKIKME